jgi:hypothetical protein
MARHPSNRQTQVLAPGGGGGSVEVALTPLEVAALLRVAKAGLDVLTALGQIDRTGVIDEALRRLHGARKGVELEVVQARALALFAARGIAILGALDLHDDLAAAEAGLVKIRAAMGPR